MFVLVMIIYNNEKMIGDDWLSDCLSDDGSGGGWGCRAGGNDDYDGVLVVVVV